MFSYYLRLALASLRRTPVLSALMVLALGLGIGAFMTTFTVYYLMSGDPIPHKSDVLFAVQLDNWDPNDDPTESAKDVQPQLTYRDFVALEQSALASESTRAYWDEKLAGLSVLQLPRLPDASRSGETGKLGVETIAPSPHSASQETSPSVMVATPLSANWMPASTVPVLASTATTRLHRG